MTPDPEIFGLGVFLCNTENNYLYTGEQYDPNAGFYYLRARYMDPSVGRFVTMDTWKGNIYDPRTLHKYVYVLNSPLSFYDPSGMVPTWMNPIIEGVLAHIVIQNCYFIDRPANNKAFEYFVTGATHTKTGRGFVDIVDFTQNEFYEIKTFNSAFSTTTRRQMTGYMDAFDFMNQSINPGTTWPTEAVKNVPWPLGGTNSYIIFSRVNPGLIAYRVVSGELDFLYAWKMIHMPEFKRMSVRQGAVYTSVIITAGASIALTARIIQTQTLVARVSFAAALGF